LGRAKESGENSEGGEVSLHGDPTRSRLG
jgi:hypothetical protein